MDDHDFDLGEKRRAATSTARRGWRETVEPGVYRSHRVSCASSRDHKPGRRCSCNWQVKVPGVGPGTTRMVSVMGAIGDARAERRRLMAEGRPTPEPLEVGTIAEFAAMWLRAKAPAWAPNTLFNREDDLRKRIIPAIGDVELSELSREHVEVWLADLISRASSRRMIVQTVATLRVMLNTAVEWGRIRDNPATRLRLPKPDADERSRSAKRIASLEQLQALFAAAGCARTETILRAAGEVGMRRGEIVGLRWPDVDLAKRRITIRRQVVQVVKDDGGHEKVVSLPKSGRESVVAMSEGLARRLADHYAEWVVERGAPADGYVWPGKDRRADAPPLDRPHPRAGLRSRRPRR